MNRLWSLTPAGWQLALHGDPPRPNGGLKLARSMARRIATARGILPLVRDELDDIALDAAAVAAARHDPARGRFSTMVFQAVRSVLHWRVAAVKRHKRAGRTERLREDDPAREPRECRDRSLAGVRAADARDEAARALSVLTPRYREALFLRHGLGWTLDAVGKKLGVHRERVRQMAEKAVARVFEKGACRER